LTELLTVEKQFLYGIWFFGNSKVIYMTVLYQNTSSKSILEDKTNFK